MAIDTVDDMRRLFEGIPLDRVSTSMTINATAPILLLLYELVAEEQGVGPSALSGTVQNDILKEYAARGTYIYPPQASMRLVTDLFGYCGERIPRWNTISISGYHMREARATAVQEVAFTLANGIAYVQAALDAGLELGLRATAVVLLRLPHALLRGGREVPRGAAPAGPDHDRALRRHRPSEPDAALPRPDRRRDAHGPAAAEQRRPHRARGAVGGARGAQSLHTNSFDEALALPTEQAAKLALTQQVLALETGVSNVADPLGGSYFVERSRPSSSRVPPGTWSGSRRWAVPSPRSNRASSRTRSTRPPSASSRRSSRGSAPSSA